MRRVRIEYVLSMKSYEITFFITHTYHSDQIDAQPNTYHKHKINIQLTEMITKKKQDKVTRSDKAEKQEQRKVSILLYAHFFYIAVQCSPERGGGGF